MPEMLSDIFSYIFDADWLIVFIAALALWVSRREGRATRKHNKLSLLPHLTFSTKQCVGENVIAVANRGVGPARITKIVVTHRALSRLMCRDEPALLDGIVREYPTISQERTFTNQLTPGDLIPARVTIDLIRSPGLPKDFDSSNPDHQRIYEIARRYEQEFYELRNHLNIHIEYESVYEEQFDSIDLIDIPNRARENGG